MEPVHHAEGEKERERERRRRGREGAIQGAMHISFGAARKSPYTRVYNESTKCRVVVNSDLDNKSSLGGESYLLDGDFSLRADARLRGLGYVNERERQNGKIIKHARLRNHARVS